MINILLLNRMQKEAEENSKEANTHISKVATSRLIVKGLPKYLKEDKFKEHF